MKFKNYIETESGIKDTSTSPGTAGQVLSSTVTGTSWIDQDEIIAAAATVVVIECKNTHTTALTKGTPVYQTGTVGATDVIEIAPGDALISTGAQPSIGLLQQDLAINAFGFVIITGELLNITTDPIDGLTPVTGQKIFVKSGGGLTLTKPTTELNSIQNMGLVGKVSGGSAGSITVSSIMRTNDVPNLPTGKIWVGDGNTVVSDTVYLDEVNNELGINTINPLAKLQVNTGSDINAQLGLDSFGSFKLGDISNNYTGRGIYYDGTAGSEDLDILTNTFNIAGGSGEGIKVVSSTDVQLSSPTGVVITINGTSSNVGIGTTSPSQKFHVSGNARVTGAYYDSNNSPGASNQVLVSTVTGTDWIDGTAIPGLVDGTGTANYVARWIGTESIGIGVIYDNGTNVGIGTTSPGEKLTLQTQATGLGSEGVFIKNPFAGSTPIVNSKSPFLSLATSNSSGYTSTIYMGRNGTATGQESKIEWSNSNDGLSIYVAGQGSYREHVRFGNLSSSVARTYFNGTVGIGTTNPATKLEINGPSHDANFTSGCLMIQQLPQGDRMFIDGNDIDCADGTLFLNDYSLNEVRTGGNFTVPNGSVGIGTTSPAEKLAIDGSIRMPRTEEFYWTDGSVNGSPRAVIFSTSNEFGGDYNGIGFSIGANGRTAPSMYIRGTGNVGIGTTSPTAKLGIHQAANNGNTGAFTNPHLKLSASATTDGSGFCGIAAATSTANNYGYSFGAQRTSGGVGDFKINYHNNSASGTNRFLIDQNGNVGIGTTSPVYQLQLSLNSAAKPTSSAWTVVSDERVKTNIRPYETGLQELLQIEPKLFDYNGKAGFDATTKNNIGVIAQEIKDVMPETVKKYNAKLNENDEEDTELYNFDSHALTFALINSVKELNAKIKSLETKIQTLENQ